MISFNSAGELWSAPPTSQKQCGDVLAPAFGLPAVSLTRSNTPEVHGLAVPDGPLCCWNLCSSIGTRKIPRPSSRPS